MEPLQCPGTLPVPGHIITQAAWWLSPQPLEPGCLGSNHDLATRQLDALGKNHLISQSLGLPLCKMGRTSVPTSLGYC